MADYLNSMKFLFLTPIFIASIFLTFLVSVPKLETGINYHEEEIEALESQESPKELIIRLAEENNFDVNTAIRIATCESQLGLYKYNLQGSSAKGIYQFIDKTWEHYCDGDVLNDEDNINCFIKLYNKHPHWWECK
jgi:hypothetical protein